MDAQTLLTADYLDILFDKRNKQYGSYQLRRQYGSRLRKGLLFILLLGALSFVFIDRSKPLINHTARTAVTELTHIIEVLPAVVPPPARATETPPPPAPAPAVRMTVPEIVGDQQVLQSGMPDVQHLAAAVPGLQDASGTGDPGAAQSLDPEGTAWGAPMSEPAPGIVFTYVEQMPEFDGVLSSYLGSQLRYPALAREHDIQGRVNVEFVVNEEGFVTDARVIRGIGGGCDEEALRVVKQMPRWEPGKQNGRPVKVLLRLPVFFKLY